MTGFYSSNGQVAARALTVIRWVLITPLDSPVEPDENRTLRELEIDRRQEGGPRFGRNLPRSRTDAGWLKDVCSRVRSRLDRSFHNPRPAPRNDEARQTEPTGVDRGYLRLGFERPSRLAAPVLRETAP